jgi:flavin reductase (DIM6/NTAB) family NADH-FMN oxidoreductase RutF
MALQDISFPRFGANVFHLFDRQWLLLASGDLARGELNAMTISWGSLGVIWGKPFVQVLVRPHRYTHGFMDRFDTFTLSAFPEAHRAALNLLGSQSGRDGDKIAASGLTPIAAARVAAPAFAEAELVLECRKIYRAPLDSRSFLDPAIEGHYPQRDYHTAYFGEIVAVRGEPRFVAEPG